MNSLRLRIEWWAMLALSVLGLWALQTSGATQRLDAQLLDVASAVAAPEASDDIVLLTVDDHSLNELGQWPWPRALHARVVDRLSDAGARAVVLDFLMVEAGDPRDLAALSEAMARSGAVYLPHTFTASANSAGQVEPLMPAEPLRRAAAGVGHVLANPDTDGVLRRFDLSYAVEGTGYPHLAAVVARDFGMDQPAVNGIAPVVPMLPVGAYTQLPVAEFLADDSNAAFVKGKIVLVGATAQGMGDQYSVASGRIGLMSGVETQANLLNALLSETLIAPLPDQVAIGLGAACILVLFVCFWFLPPKHSLFATVSIAALVTFASILLVWGARLWFGPGAILATLAIAYPMWSWRRLSGLSRFIEQEIDRLGSFPAAPQAAGGLDFLARQTRRFQNLIQAMRQSLAFVEHVIEVSPDAILILDERGEIEALNSHARNLFAASGSVVGASFTELMMLARMTRSASGDDLTTQDGRVFLIARADLSVAGPAGPPGHLGTGEILALREVTQARRLEEERKQMLEFLSHDMRTPQVAIIALSRQLENGSGSAETADRIRSQAQRTLKLADDFVQIARIEQTGISPEDCDLIALAEEACDRAFAPAEAARVAVRHVSQHDHLFASVDGAFVARMLDNLIGNAIKYCSAGDQVTIEIDQSEDQSVFLVVADTGPGLPQARLEEPFARFGAHATQAGPSAGLGLALVKKVAEAHQGTVTVESAPGNGTRFIINFPPDHQAAEAV